MPIITGTPVRARDGKLTRPLGQRRTNTGTTNTNPCDRTNAVAANVSPAKKYASIERRSPAHNATTNVHATPNVNSASENKAGVHSTSAGQTANSKAATIPQRS